MDHSFGDVDALLVVAHQASPAREPAEGALYHPAPRQRLEARLVVDAANDLDDEVEESGLVHELRPVIGAVREQVLEPRPALADGIEDHLRAGAVGEARRGEIDHQQATVGIHRHMPLASDRLLGGIIAPPRSRRRRLDRLAVDDACTRARFASGPLAVHHQRNVVDGAEQHHPHEAAEPPIDGLPGRKILRQHAPTAARAGHIADGVQHLAQVHIPLAPPLRRLGQQRRNPLPFFIGEIGRITLRLPLDRGHTASRRSCPHGNRESQRR